MVRQSNIEVVIPFKRVAKMQRPQEKAVAGASPRRSARLASTTQNPQRHTKRDAPIHARRVGASDLSDEIIEQIFLACVETFPFTHATRYSDDTYNKDNVPWAFDGVNEKDSLAPWLAVKSHKLKQLCLVNKRFKRIADSILYRYVTIHISTAPSLRSKHGTTAILHLLSQPDHARHIESLHFMYPRSILPGGTSEYVSNNQKKVNSIFGKDTKTVPALAELISACPNVRNLRIEIGNMDIAAAKDVGMAIRSLQHLDRLHIHISNRAEVAAGAILAQIVPRNRKLSSLFLVFQTLSGIHALKTHNGMSGKDIEPQDILSGVWTDRLVLAPLIKPSFMDDYEIKFMLEGLRSIPKSLEVQGHYFSEALGDYLTKNGDRISRLSLDNFDSPWRPPAPSESLTSCKNLITLHLASSPHFPTIMASVPHVLLQKLSLTWWDRHIDLFTPLLDWLSINKPAQLLEIKVKVELTGLRVGTYVSDLRVLQDALVAAISCDEWCNDHGIIQKPASFKEIVQEEIDSIMEVHRPLSGEQLDYLMQAALGGSQEADEEVNNENDELDHGHSDDGDMSETMSEDSLLLIEAWTVD